MKKYLIIVLALIFALSMAFAVGCSQDNKLETDKTSISINIGETANISVKNKDVDKKELIWSSSDQTVVVVYNGILTPISIGSATITVKYKDQEAKVSVTVNNGNGLTPLMYVGDSQISLYKNKTFQITPITTWFGEKVDTDYTYQSSDRDVLEVSNDGLITAKDEGTALITISTVYKGIAIEEQIEVNVVVDAQSIVLVAGQMIGKHEFEMNVNDQVMFSIKTVYNGQEVSELEYQTQNAGKTQTSVNGGVYTIKANALGSERITLTAEYDGVQFNTYIDVNIVTKYVDYTEELFVDMSKRTDGIEIILPDVMPVFDGIAIKLSQGGEEIQSINIDTAKNSLTLAKNSVKAGKYSVSVGTDEFKYTFPVYFVSKVFYQSDVANFSTIINADLDGIYLLGENLTFKNGNSDVKITTIGKKSSTQFDEFTGVFDGCGYSMLNVQLGREGGSWWNSTEKYRCTVFAKLNGTVKNVYVEYLAPNLANASDVAFVGECHGLVENVYVKMTIRNTLSNHQYYGASAALVSRLSGDSNGLRNCVGEIVLDGVSDTDGIVLASLVGIAYTGRTIQNCYGVINGINYLNHVNCAKKVNDGLCSYYTSTGITFPTSVEKVDTRVGLINKSFSQLDGWAEYWQLKAEGLYFGNTLIVAR